MKYKLQYSPEALKDLDDAWEYILLELCNPDAAERIVTMILNTVDLLCEQPFIGTELDAVVNVESDYRFLVCESYLVFYRVEGSFVFVDRVLHERQNYMHVLFGEK